MRAYEEPRVEVIVFSVEDVITASAPTEELPPLDGLNIGDNCI